jgi:hypothetical protein
MLSVSRTRERTVALREWQGEAQLARTATAAESVGSMRCRPGRPSKLVSAERMVCSPWRMAMAAKMASRAERRAESANSHVQ